MSLEKIQKASPLLKTKEGAPSIQRPDKNEVEGFPQEAKHLITTTQHKQVQELQRKQYHINQLKGKHFILAGATGMGLGAAIACAVLDLIRDSGSLVILSRDLTKSLGFETGQYLQALANQHGLTNRFTWLNDGMALEGPQLDKIIHTLQTFKAQDLIYINTVAAASSGMIDTRPPIRVKDIDETGLFEWILQPLSEKAIHTTKFFMGEMAVQFPDLLKQHGFNVQLGVFADWRGSLDTISRDPRAPEYGRQGAYSTSLYLPKEIIQREVRRRYRTQSNYIDIFYPIMKTRALSLIPGGRLMAALNENLMNKAKITQRGVPELALDTLECVYENLSGNSNPFPRLDTHEIALDLWFHEVLLKLTNDDASPFYYKHWVESS